MLTRPLDIGELTQSAGTIVHARVIRVEQGTHPDFPNISVVNITLEVLRNVRGPASRYISFRQWIPPVRRVGVVSQASPPKFSNAGGYHVGQETVLFLYPNSRYGLTSPVGADQGIFEVVRGAAGAQVRNAAGNTAVFADIPSAARRAGVQLSASEVTATSNAASINLDTLLNLVTRFAQSGRQQ